MASLSKPTSRVDLCTLTKASKCHFHLRTDDEMPSLDYWVVPHLSTERLLNCYPEQIYIEITNDTQQTNEGITTEGPVSLESQLPPRELLLASAHLSAPRVEGEDREPGKQWKIIGRIPLLCSHPFAPIWLHFKSSWLVHWSILSLSCIFFSVVNPSTQETGDCS